MVEHRGAAGRLGQASALLIAATFGFFSMRGIFEPVTGRVVPTVIYSIGLIALTVAGFVEWGIPRLGLPVLLLAVWTVLRYCLALFLETASAASAVSVFQYAVPPLAFFVAWNAVRSRAESMAIKTLVGGALVSIVAGLLIGHASPPIMHQAVGDRVLVQGQTIQRFTSPAGNSLATGYLAAIAAVLVGAMGGWGLTLLPLFIFAILNSFSRGAMILVVTGGVSLMLAAIRRWRVRSNASRLSMKVYGATLLFLLGLGGTVVLSGHSSEVIEGRFVAGMVNLREPGNAQRLESWKASLDLWSRAPVIGVGPGQLGGSAVKRAVRRFAPESMYLKVLGELGVIGLTLFALSICGVLRRMLSTCWWRRPKAVMSLSLCLGVLAASFFLQVIEYDFFALIFWFFLGCGSAVQTKRLRGSERKAGQSVAAVEW